MRIQPLSLLTPRTHLVPSLRELAIRVKDDIRSYVDQGWYQTLAEGIAIYQIKKADHAHTGILALNDIRDFHLGKIKKHEKTLTRREAEYHLLLQEWKSVIKPVLLTFPTQPALSEWMQQYTAAHQPSFTLNVPEDGEEHVYWLVTEPADLEKAQLLFADIDAVYIADGHHRTTTIANFAQLPDEERAYLDFSHLFAAFFPDDQLRILGYHRLMTFADEPETEKHWEYLNTVFDVLPVDTPRLPAYRREIMVVRAGQCFSLDLSALGQEIERLGPVLDTNLLNDLVFKHLFHVEDARSDKRITYVDGASGLSGMLAATEQTPNAIGFLLHPVSFGELYTLSDRNEPLPPKSTWFEPRIKSGFAVYSLEEK
jgi:uncharacterized protein (DUF1015 family)